MRVMPEHIHGCPKCDCKPASYRESGVQPNPNPVSKKKWKFRWPKIPADLLVVFLVVAIVGLIIMLFIRFSRSVIATRNTCRAETAQYLSQSPMTESEQVEWRRAYISTMNNENDEDRAAAMANYTIATGRRANDTIKKYLGQK